MTALTAHKLSQTRAEEDVDLRDYWTMSVPPRVVHKRRETITALPLYYSGHLLKKHSKDKVRTNMGNKHEEM